jgi:colanic acid biosynthesis glycosyl transferase WcaI
MFDRETDDAMTERLATKRRPRVLVFNQYYWPGLEATAHLLSQLCEALVTDFDVTVVTGKLRQVVEPGRAVHNGVQIVRVNSTAFDRTQLIPRGINYLTFLLKSFWVGIRAERPDVVLCMTDPPVIANVALPVSRRFGVSLVVISQDVFPEIAVQLRRLEQPVLVEVLRRLIAFYLRRADRIVAIGETMRARLEQKGANPDRLVVIPNWVDTNSIKPMPRHNDWALEHGFGSTFVVMHSGNIGHAQDLETLIQASTFLRDLDDLAVAIIGAGARLASVQSVAARLEADAVQFLPYQPRELVSQSLSSADVHYVGLARGLAGFVVPSRLYGILAVGRPVLVSADAESETARIVQEMDCGIAVSAGRPDLVAEAIRDIRGGRYDLEAMGARGRQYVVREADRSVAVGRYRDLLLELCGRT